MLDQKLIELVKQIKSLTKGRFISTAESCTGASIRGLLYICVYIDVYIYVYIEREREISIDRSTDRYIV